LTTDVKRETKDPASLPEDIYRLFLSDADHEVSEENVEWAGEVLKDLLRSRLKKREEKKGEEVLRFSALGKKDRQIWYDANMPEASEKLPGKMGFKFLYGDVLELLMLFLAKEAGHEVTHEQHEVDVDGIKGHMDAVIDGIPVDCKSASSYSYQKFLNGSFQFDDPFGYIPQLSGYAHAIGKTDRAGFLVCDKVHGDICFAEIDEYIIGGNPPAPRIEELKKVLAQPEPPARCYPDEAEGKSGNKKLGLNCSYCKYKDECWKDANGGQGLRKFFYSRGPVWLTTVKKEPRVDEQ
jgi:hypothetical protein